MTSPEESLRAAVAELLHTEPDRIPVDRSLISLGFDSILAINLQHHLQDTLGLTISIADLMAGRTIHELAVGHLGKWLLWEVISAGLVGIVFALIARFQ